LGKPGETLAPLRLGGNKFFLWKMNSYNLNIAGYNIRLEAASMETQLIPGKRFNSSICNENDSDVTITVFQGSYNFPSDAERVFHAPLVEEIDGDRIKKSDNFWSIYKHRTDLIIKTIFPYTNCEKEGYLRFNLNSRSWDLFLPEGVNNADPLEYPIDGLILYYLTVMNGDIMVHASGVSHAGKGYLFSGVSGKGKTTMARLWDSSGGKVIHDDRLIIRRMGDKYMMFNTPVYADDKPNGSPLTRIFLIEHGYENMMIPVSGAMAVSLMLANCIQHNWNPEIIARLMGSVSIMCSEVQVAKLKFLPDRSIIDYIMEYE
jgi:hypothetical protein